MHGENSAGPTARAGSAGNGQLTALASSLADMRSSIVTAELEYNFVIVRKHRDNKRTHKAEDLSMCQPAAGVWSALPRSRQGVTYCISAKANEE